MNLTGIWSGPVELSNLIDFSCYRTSLWVTLRRQNVSDILYCKESIIGSRLTWDVGVVPRRRCVVELKCSFSMSGSVLIGLGLGWKIRLIIFQSPLDFLVLYGGFYSISNVTKRLAYIFSVEPWCVWSSKFRFTQ